MYLCFYIYMAIKINKPPINIDSILQAFKKSLEKPTDIRIEPSFPQGTASAYAQTSMGKALVSMQSSLHQNLGKLNLTGLKEKLAKKMQELGQNLPTEKEAINFLLKKLKNNQGIIIGDDCHFSPLPHDFVAKNMSKLKGRGIKQIYLEYFPEHTQHMLDRYFEKGDNLDELISYLGDNRTHPTIPLTVVQEAKKYGIKCFGIDTEGTVQSRNHHWQSVVRKNSATLTGDDKWLLIGGTAHLQARGKVEQGIEKLLQAPVLETYVPFFTFLDKVKKPPNSFQVINENHACLAYPEK